eukprot:scaffold10131_cov82-Skeletonema_dohrnii-CCMP3373.AAC.3
MFDTKSLLLHAAKQCRAAAAASLETATLVMGLAANDSIASQAQVVKDAAEDANDLAMRALREATHSLGAIQIGIVGQTTDDIASQASAKAKGVTIMPKNMENLGVVSRTVGTATKTATKATDEALSTAKAATSIAAAQTNAALSLMDAGNALEYAATNTAQAVGEALDATTEALGVAGEAVGDAMATTMSVLGR